MSRWVSFILFLRLPVIPNIIITWLNYSLGCYVISLISLFIPTFLPSILTFEWCLLLSVRFISGLFYFTYDINNLHVCFRIYDLNYEFFGNQPNCFRFEFNYDWSWETACLQSLTFQFLRFTKHSLRIGCFTLWC